MSGHDSGLQIHVKEVNDLTYYVNCCTRKLNLIFAATCSHERYVFSFIENIETLYTFITSILFLKMLRMNWG